MPVYPKYLWLVSVRQLFRRTHASYSNSRGHCTRYVRLTNAYMANTFTDGPSASQPSLHYSGSYLMNAVQAIQIQQQADTADGPRDELHKYLKSGAETTADIVGWWGEPMVRFGVREKWALNRTEPNFSITSHDLAGAAQYGRHSSEIHIRLATLGATGSHPGRSLRSLLHHDREGRV